MADEINPYAPTVTPGLVTPELTDAETLRKTHLNHEASVKAIGILISVYIRYLLLSQKGKVVFSDHYQQVITQTSQIRYKASTVVWIQSILVLILLGVAILAALLA